MLQLSLSFLSPYVSLSFFSFDSSFHCFDLSGARFLSSICSVQSILAIDTRAFRRLLLKERKELVLGLSSPWYSLQLTGVSLLCSECFCLVKVVLILVCCCYTDRVCSLRFSSLLWPRRVLFAFSALCPGRVSQC